MRSLRRVDQAEPLEIKPYPISNRDRIPCPRRPNRSVKCALNSIPQRGKLKPGGSETMQGGASQRRQGSGVGVWRVVTAIAFKGLNIKSPTLTITNLTLIRPL